VATERFTVRTPPYPYPPGASVDLYVRPEHIVLVRPEHEREPRRGNLVRGRIVDELHLGPVHTLYFSLLDAGEAGAGSPPAAHCSEGRGGEARPAHDLEVDLAAHPYQALRVAERREWLLSLVPEALHLTPPHGLGAEELDETLEIAGGAPMGSSR
jgi:hypothetical protein